MLDAGHGVCGELLNQLVHQTAFAAEMMMDVRPCRPNRFGNVGEAEPDVATQHVKISRHGPDPLPGVPRRSYAVQVSHRHQPLHLISTDCMYHRTSPLGCRHSLDSAASEDAFRVTSR